MDTDILDAVLDALAVKLAGKIQPAAPKDLYTVEDLAERYAVSESTVVRWMRDGEFGACVNPTPRMHLVTLAGIRDFEARHTGPAYAGSSTPAVPVRRRKAPVPGRN